MSEVDKAIATQLQNIQAKTGKALHELEAQMLATGLTKHGELRDYFIKEMGLGHGDANTLVHILRKTDGASMADGLDEEAILTSIYTGTKADLRPIHDRLMVALADFGTFEVAPKKGYVSLRRKKQFAMIGPGSKSRVDVGINMKGVDGTDRLIALPPGKMCQYNVKMTSADEVDEELLGWLREAFQQAG
ncbi:MAG TPA: DUF5655 domain-containing protein [Rhodothermales bacterium]|nr:DUF5655 domain-containing protein [Rhodothermales bacterium]